MKPAYTLIFLLISIFSYSQTYSGPESIEYDYANNRWLIANTQSHQVLARDSIGNLSVFVSGLVNGPYGIEIVGDTLFCCSGSSIKGYLLSNASLVFNVNLGATFLNGITHDLSGNLIVTDFSAKTIYKLNILTQQDTIIASGLVQSPNGITYDEINNRCIFVNWGSNAPIKAINLATYVVSIVVGTTLGSCDGIAYDNHGNYYVSNWSNQSIVQFDSSFSNPPVTVVSSLNNPADLFYNVLSDTLGIPNAGNNTVVFFGFNTVSVTEHEKVMDWGLFPNPSCNQSFVRLNMKKSGEIKLKLFNFSGTQIEERTIFANEGVNTLPVLSDNQIVNSGIYLIQIVVGDLSKTFKLIFN